MHCTLDGLQPLLEEKFDSKVFATRAIQSQVVGETLKRLGQGIIDLNEEIRAQVCISKTVYLRMYFVFHRFIQTMKIYCHKLQELNH